MYENFNKSLDQVACEAPSTQRYSLARNCSDCAAAYKEWLCSVTIPRCEDFSNDAPYLQPRAMSQLFPGGEGLDEESRRKYPNITAFNSSRNPLIDSEIKPGPYKEVLPCDDICYNIVQSCPSSLGFGCPLPKHGDVFKYSYTPRKVVNENGSLSCNYQGSAYFRSSSTRETPRWYSLAGMAVAVGLGLLLL